MQINNSKKHTRNYPQKLDQPRNAQLFVRRRGRPRPRHEGRARERAPPGQQCAREVREYYH